MDKYKLKLSAFRFLEDFDPKIRTKLDNICGKTGQYNIPTQLFQNRTSRKNRILISWKTIKKNNMTLERLATFSGGVVVEFVNEDYFEESNQTDPLFIALKEKLGSDDVVSSIITIRSENGDSSSAHQRACFSRLLDNTRVVYKGQEIFLNQDNYLDYKIRQLSSGGVGNEKWDGFIYILITGGQQDSIKSHTSSQTIFNPAVEFASEEVTLDLNLTMAYFALRSIDVSSLNWEKVIYYNNLMEDMRTALKGSEYRSEAYEGNLLDYCDDHPCLRFIPGKLCDPIQVVEIDIRDFAIDKTTNPESLDLTHDEAVNFEKFYWDEIKNCYLSPARPTNVFWSKHLSNMMQQNFSLQQYFDYQREIVRRRENLYN